MKISEKAIQYPLPVIILTLGMFVASIISYIILPLELVPDIEVPYAVVSATYTGASPDEIESEVIKPMEEQLSKLKDTKKIQSFALQNVAFFTIEFSPEADLDESINDLKEKVNDAIPDLPDGVDNVTVQQVDFADIPILILNIYGNFSPHDLHVQAELIKDRLTMLSSVNSVDVFGGKDREISVKVDPSLLLANHLSIPQIIQALQKSNINFPGGVLKMDQQDVIVRTIGKHQTVEDIENTIIGMGQDGNIKRIRDVAVIVDGYEEAETYSRYNGLNSITLLITKKTGVNIVEASEEVEEIVEDLAQRFPSGMLYAYTARQSEDIERQSRELNQNAAWGIVFIVIILFLGIGFRNALIVSVALPFSMMTSFLFMYFFGLSRTGISMFGLIMVLGIVVDGAIIVAEATYRHIEDGYERKEAAIAAMQEVGMPIFTSVLTTMVAFGPIMFMTGIMGQFLSVIPKVVIFALIGAFVADHFLIPVLASKYMRISKRKGFMAGEWWGKHAYTRLLHWSLHNRWKTLFASFFVFFLSLVVVGISMATDLKLVKVEIFPQVPQPRIIIDITTEPGSQLEFTDVITNRIEDYLKNMPEVDRYVSTVGQSGLQNIRLNQGGSLGAEIAQINIDLVDKDDRKRSVGEVIAELSERWGKLPGVDIIFGTVQEGPPIATNVVIDIHGDNLEEMEIIADQVKKKLETIPGALNVQTSVGIRRTELQVLVDHDRAASYGLSSRDISSTIAAAFFGIEATNFTDGLEDIPVKVKLDVDETEAIDAIQNLNIPNLMGEMIPFSNVASLVLSSGQHSIKHKNFKRNISIFCDLAPGVDATDIQRKITPFLHSLQLPSWMAIEFGGIEDEATKSFKSLGRAMIIGFCIIIFILSAQFRSLRQPFIIALTIPLSFIGVIFGLMITRVPFGLMAFFGVVALMGVVVNDAIVLISYINDVRRQGMGLYDAIIKGGRNRLRPIILTTVTTMAGMIPLTLNFAGGAEYWRPLAVSLIFGLAIASFLTLIVVPIFYLLLEGRGERKRVAKVS